MAMFKWQLTLNSKSKEGAAFNLGRTVAVWIQSSCNSFENDFSFSVGQSFEFPTVYGKQKQLANEQVVGGQKQLAVTENDLKWKII